MLYIEQYNKQQLVKSPFFFLKKQRVFFFKSIFKKKGRRIKYYYTLVSRRKFNKLYSRFILVDFFNEKKWYKKNRKFSKFIYLFNMNSGLKNKAETLNFIKFWHLTDGERLHYVNYTASIHYFNNVSNIWNFFKYFFFNLNFEKDKYISQQNIINKYKHKFDFVKDYEYFFNFKHINPNLERFKFNKRKPVKGIISLMPKYNYWYYIYNIFTPSIKFIYLHSYNSLLKIKKNKFRWFYKNFKNKKYKNNIFFYKFKNKKVFLFLYNFLFYSNFYNQIDLFFNIFYNNFNFFFNTKEYFILNNYISFKYDLEVELKGYFCLLNNNLLINKYNNSVFFNKNTFNINNMLTNYLLINKLYYYLFIFNYLKLKYKKIIKIKKNFKIKQKNLKFFLNKKFNKFFIYFYLCYYLILVDFIMNILKYSFNYNLTLKNKNCIKNLYYTTYFFKLLWFHSKIKKC